MERSRTQPYPRGLLVLVTVMGVTGFLVGSLELIEGGHDWSGTLVWIAAIPAIPVSLWWMRAITVQGPDTRRLRLLRSTGLGLGILSTVAAASCLYEGIMGTIPVWKAGLGFLAAVSAAVVVWYVRRLDTVARGGHAPS